MNLKMTDSFGDESSKKTKAKDRFTAQPKKVPRVEEAKSIVNLENVVVDDGEIIKSKRARRFDPIWKWLVI